MVVWQVWCAAGILLLIIEMFTPALFFLNLAVAAFISAIFAYYGFSFIVQTIVFAIVAALLILFLRPLMLSKIKHKSQETGMNDKYIGKVAKVVKEITNDSGRIAIYGEEWDARTCNDEVIPVGTNVIINSNESIIMYVEKEGC